MAATAKQTAPSIGTKVSPSTISATPGLAAVATMPPRTGPTAYAATLLLVPSSPLTANWPAGPVIPVASSRRLLFEAIWKTDPASSPPTSIHKVSVPVTASVPSRINAALRSRLSQMSSARGGIRSRDRPSVRASTLARMYGDAWTRAMASPAGNPPRICRVSSGRALMIMPFPTLEIRLPASSAPSRPLCSARQYDHSPASPAAAAIGPSSYLTCTGGQPARAGMALRGGGAGWPGDRRRAIR